VADPVAWTLIEHGWTVIDADGNEIGKVAEITGDENADIFDGIAVSEGLLSGKKYVPSEQVGEIVDGAVHLTVRADALADFTEPAPEEQVVPEASTWYQRIAWRWLTGRKR
jgi:uncharacterized protein YrrD